MARDHAQIRLSIWDDDDFRSLPANAQHLYWMLLIHPELSYCGVLDWRPAKLSGFVGDWTADDVRAAVDVLIERLYVLVDEDTEEILVRSFVRRDGLMKQPKMATAMATAHAAVGSVQLRGVIISELQRLHREEPELKGWGSEKASALLTRPSVDPSAYPCGKGLRNPSANPSGNPKPEGSGKGSASPLLLAPSSFAPSSQAPDDSSLRSESERPRRSRPAETSTDEEDPTAQSLVRAYVDLHTRRPPNNVVGQVARHIKGLLGEGFEAEHIRRALVDLVRKGLGPSTLPSLVNEVANRPAARGPGSLSKREIDDVLGQDPWQLPAPPFDPEEHPDRFRQWARETSDAHRAERERLAFAQLERTASSS